MNMMVASSSAMFTIMANSNDTAMILIKTVINRVVVLPMFQWTLIDITTQSEGGRMIVASSNDMATIVASRNDIAMILIMTVINGVVVRPMGVAPSMVILTAITMVGVVVRCGRMVFLADITVMIM